MAAKKKATAKKAPAKKALAKKAAPKKPAAKPKAAPRKGPMPPLPRAPGEKLYWLLKTEPEVFSIDDILASPASTTSWDGVRNFLARNYMRDQMRLGDGVLIYHSNADPPGIAGFGEIAREGYPDHTALEQGHHHFDPDSNADQPTWFMVDVKALKKLAWPLSLDELREVPGLGKMVLLQKGSRLSVQPVSAAEWKIVKSIAR